MKTRSLPALLLPLAFGAAVFPASARAQGGSIEAEALFRDGKADMDRGDYVTACPKLFQSYHKEPATGALLALAECQEKSSTFASAWANYLETAARARRENDEARAEAAIARATALEAQLSRIAVVVPEDVARIPGLQVRRDGVLLATTAWGVPAPIDGGSHVVEATAPGKQSFSVRLDFNASGDLRTVGVPPLQDLRTTLPPPASVSHRPVDAPRSTAPAPEDSREASQAAGGTMRSWGLVLGGIGVVGLGVATVFGVQAMSLDRDSKAQGRCDATGCNAEGYGIREDARTAGDVATGLTIAGGVLLATGVTLFFAGTPTDGGVALRAGPGQGGGRIAFQGAF